MNLKCTPELGLLLAGAFFFQPESAQAQSGKNRPPIPDDLVFEENIAYLEGHPRWVST